MDLTEDFIDLFMILSNVNGYSLYATCDGCRTLVVTDYTSTRYAMQTIRYVMKLFYCQALQYDYIPWGICEECYAYLCPACVFNVIAHSMSDGMLTTHCSVCNHDFSYNDVMDTLSIGEVLIFNVNYDSEEDDRFTQDDYLDLVTQRFNETETECPICFLAKSRMDFLACGHGFCPDCLFYSLQVVRYTDSTLVRARHCPMCRHPFPVLLPRH